MIDPRDPDGLMNAVVAERQARKRAEFMRWINTPGNRDRWNKARRERRKVTGKRPFYTPEESRRRARSKELQRLYGLTFEQVELLKAKQGFVCAVCSKPKKLCVDHNHTTGKVRELLCSGCNLLVGVFEVRPQIAEALSEYLARHK